MADRYRLPDVLGGGEYEAEYSWSGCAGATPEYRFTVPGVGWVTVATKESLTKVELPPEWPHGTVVLVDGSHLYERDDAAASDDEMHWYKYGEAHSWAQVCADGTPVRMVPDPAAGVDLPWRGDGNGATSWLAVGDWGHAEAMNLDLVPLIVASAGRLMMPVLTPVTARAMAAALLAAADVAEAVSRNA